MIRVFVNGAFDLLHSGHLAFLKQAREQGDYLIVGLNSDASIGKYKSKDRPIENQETRKKKLLETKMVDEVIIFDEPSPMRIINEVRPDIIVRGHDQTIEPELSNYRFYRARQVGDISTTKILSKS
jgi:rfaE bifunctional protein nucleotidyltransferase chain/domain